MRAFALLIVATLLLGGCLAAEDNTKKPTSTAKLGRPSYQAAAVGEDARTLRTVVHGVEGILLRNDSWIGDVPVVEQRYVGAINGVEPTVAVGPSGTAYYVGVYPSNWPQVYRTKDQGKTWQDVTPQIAPGVDFPPFTNDPFIDADPITGRVFTVDLSATVDCSTVWYSDNEGDSWQLTTTDPCAITRASHDHQSLVTGIPVGDRKATGYANLVHYCVNRGSALCYTSLDGGRTYGTPVNTGLNFCGGLTGHVQTGPDGTVYLPQVACGQMVKENWAKVAVSRDGGRTWKVHVVSQTTEPSRMHTSSHEGNIAVDAAGNVYFLFLDREQMPVLSVSRDHGETWSPPQRVAAPGVTATTLGSIAAGDEGRIAVFYIGTTADGGHVPKDANAATWNAYVGYSFNALDAAPVFVTTTANPLADPLKRGTCSGRCFGNGPNPALQFQGMYDFLDIDIDPKTGRIWAALVDLCNGPCGQPGATAASEQSGRGAVAVQVSGPMLRVGAASP